MNDEFTDPPPSNIRSRDRDGSQCPGLRHAKRKVGPAPALREEAPGPGGSPHQEGRRSARRRRSRRLPGGPSGGVGGDAEHLDGVERVDAWCRPRRRPAVLEREVVGDRLAELLEHPDVALDDQAGVLLVQVVVAVDREVLQELLPDVEPFLELRRGLARSRPSCRPWSPRRRAGGPRRPSSVISAMAPVLPVADSSSGRPSGRSSTAGSR